MKGKDLINTNSEQRMLKIARCLVNRSPNRQKVTLKEALEFKKLYKEGLTTTEIAKKCNRHRTTILRYLRKLGVYVERKYGLK